MKNIALNLSNPVAAGGTITGYYPSGESRTSYMQSGAVLVIGNNTYTTGFTLTLGASSFTVTNPGPAIASGAAVRIALNTPAEAVGLTPVAIATAAGHIEYPGPPVGVLTPDFVGQRCQDTVTGVFYVATTTSSSGWVPTSSLARTAILSGASAGTSTAWLSISDAPERFAYQLDSGSTTTTFSVDVSADGSTSLGQAFTGTYASSSVAEITPLIMFSAPTAKYFRWNVLTGGPLSVSRGY